MSTSDPYAGSTSALSFRRWAVILAAGASGVLVLISMFVDPVPSADGAELLQGYAEHRDRQGLHTNLIHYGFALFAPAAYGMVGLVRGRGAWWANVAGVLAVLGLSTLPGLVLVDFLGVAMVDEVGVDTAEQIQQRSDAFGWFAAVIAPAFLASLLAVPVAALATWRAGLVRLWVPVTVTLGFLAVNVVPNAILGFSLLALACVGLAYALWRIPPVHWHPVAGTADPAAAVMTQR